MPSYLEVMLAGVDRCSDFIEPSYVSWGRSSLDAQPDAATFTGVMRCDTPAEVPALGATLDVRWHEDSFGYITDFYLIRGYITDVSVEVVDGVRYASVLAADPLSVLADIYVGDEPWPTEYASVRLERILNLAAPIAGWSYGLSQSILFIGLLPRDVDRAQALKLCKDTADAADGVFYFDHGANGFYNRTEGFRLYNRDATIGTPTQYWLEGSPRQYRNKANVINVARAAYGTADPQLIYEASDAASISAHLRRFKSLGDQYWALSDAQTVVDAVVARWAQPRWTLEGCTLTATTNGMRKTIAQDWQDPRRLVKVCTPYDETAPPLECRILSCRVELRAADWEVTMTLQEA